MNESTKEQTYGEPPAKRARKVKLGIVATGLALAIASLGLVLRSEAKVNKVALDSLAKPVSFVRTTAATFRPYRMYVGALRPWVSADVGPQFLSAYVDAILVRPGATVKRGDVLATLDCRNASAASSAVAMQARAIEAKQKALADEANRTARLLDGGYASANETEIALASSAAEQAQLEAERATFAHSNLEVGDCIQRAPFAGEVGDRFLDPGTFVRPGAAIVSVIDRTTVRFTGDVPEGDFGVVAPGTAVDIHAEAVNLQVQGIISRRAPHADSETRTVHFEVDLPNGDRRIPVDTTGEAHISYGAPIAVVDVPLYGATVRGSKATVYVIEGDVVHAKTVAVLGETGGKLHLDPSLGVNARVVTEGRALLGDGDHVTSHEEAAVTAAAP